MKTTAVGEPGEPKLKVVANGSMSEEDQAALDREEADYRALCVDDDDGAGSTGAGLIAIGVAKVPSKEEFFRTHPTMKFPINMVESRQGIDTAYLAVIKEMVEPMIGIGFRPSLFRLYLTITRQAVIRFVPVKIATDGKDPNSWNLSKEAALQRAMPRWTRMTADQAAQQYQVYSLETDAYPAPEWPAMTPQKLIGLAFRQRGHLIDSQTHPYFLKLIGREPV